MAPTPILSRQGKADIESCIENLVGEFKKSTSNLCFVKGKTHTQAIISNQSLACIRSWPCKMYLDQRRSIMKMIAATPHTEQHAMTSGTELSLEWAAMYATSWADGKFGMVEEITLAPGMIGSA